MKPIHIDRIMKRHISLLFMLLAAAMLAGKPARADNETGREEYEIPDHGILIMDVPVEWQATFYKPEDDGFPIISFHPFKGPDTFQLSVGIFWSTDALRELTDPHNLRRFVENVGQNVLEQADQDSLDLEEIVGHSGIGYLFDLTDMDAGEDEYQYLTQGALAVGNIVVVFSLFTREDQQQEIRQETLEMLKNAKQDLSRRDVNYKPAVN